MKPKSIYIGIDLATTASKTGCCILAEESDGTLHSLQNELVPRDPASSTRLNTDAIVAGIATLTRAHPVAPQIARDTTNKAFRAV